MSTKVSKNASRKASIDAAVRRAVARFSTYWDDLTPEQAQLAEMITRAAEEVGGRGKACKIMGISPVALDNYRQGKSQPKALDMMALMAARDTAVRSRFMEAIMPLEIKKRQLAEQLSKSTKDLVASFSRLQLGRAETTASLRSVPLLGTAAGSLVGSMTFPDGGDHVLQCPPGLANSPDGYALRLTGSSMEPRYWPGDIIFVDPARPVRRGDIVVIQTQDWDGSDILAWLKQLERRDGEWVRVRQYNPPSEIAWKAANVRFIHRVLTANEVMGFA
jgi:phage repressor protein C with HTH and peptisase S24 domain